MNDEVSMGELLVVGVLTLFWIISMWIVFTKADQPGWAILVPIFNVYILLKVAGMSGWWLLATFIPIVNLLPAILVPINISERFGKGLLFAAGLFFLPFIFFPILAFGDAQWSAVS